MPVMFIPAAVGLMESWGIIKEAFVPYLVITMISTIIMMIAAGRVTQYFAKRGKK